MDAEALQQLAVSVERGLVEVQADAARLLGRSQQAAAAFDELRRRYPTGRPRGLRGVHAWPHPPRLAR
jgi:hypothetical protein